MRSKFKLFLALALTIFAGSVGHSQPLKMADSMAHYAHELVRNLDLGIREKAFNYLNENLGSFMAEYSDFQDSFPRYEGLAILEDFDLKLRIITYQLYEDTSSYSYGGWVQNDQLEDPVFLTDGSGIWEDDPDLGFMNLNVDNWYGALYYQLLPVSVSHDSMVVVLFGLDNYHFFTKRKVLEILVIDQDGVHFGESMIEMEEGLPREFWKKRFILDYSVQAPATLRYDPDREKIIFDHLIFMGSDIAQQKIMRVPDGTYSGFDIDKMNHKLMFIEKVFDQVMDEAPGGRENTGESKDLFGNSQKN